MQKIFSKGAELEKLSKEKFFIPPFLMMENAARAMADFILTKNPEQVLIVCGKGNNGGDGYALGRMLQDKAQITILAAEDPATEEAATQFKMCQNLGITIVENLPENFKADVIADCLYGIGFHGELRPQAKVLLDQINLMTGLKIACDIPSGLYFKADYTITMGEQKTALYSDDAKTICGQIIVADLGISRKQFQSQMQPDAFLIEPDDVLIPLRTNKKAHKGTYGHTAVFAGEKSGAGIIAATTAMNSGSGLTTLVKTAGTRGTDLSQFQISPELMLSESIPPKTTAIVAGPGLGQNPQAVEMLITWLKATPKSAAVLDADMLTVNNPVAVLDELQNLPEVQVVLTPHLSEFSRLLQQIAKAHPEAGITEELWNVQKLACNAELKLQAGRLMNRLYPFAAVIIKSANTFIAVNGEVFVCADGVQSLAKGGSGDVLAGLTGALLAQGYSAKDAAVTAVELHALAARNFGAQNYDLTPLKLINQLIGISEK